MGAMHGLFHIGAVFRFSEMIESHVDVGADGPLGLHGRFRCDFKIPAVDVGFEFDAFFADFDIGETEDLKTTGVGEGGFVPAVKSREATGLFD